MGEIDSAALTVLRIDEVLFTEEVCTDRDGKVTRTRRQLTEEEPEEVAELNEDYLAEAGVKPFPRGMALYLTAPAGVTTWGEFAARLMEHVGEQPTLPSEQAAASRGVLPRLYAVAGR